MRVNVFFPVIVSAAWLAVSTIAVAQNAPARETPRGELEPRVDTSTPPEELEPRVNTSAPEDEPATSRAASGDGSTGARGTAPATSTPAPATSSSSAGTRDAAAAKPDTRGRAVDRLELDTTQITGNRELPKVLYIVPWKRSDLGDLVGKPINSLVDEVLTPVDRDVFQRENRYYRALTPGAVENDALSAPDARPSAPTRNPVPTNSAPAAGSPGSATHPANASGTGGSTGSGSAAPPRRDEK